MRYSRVCNIPTSVYTGVGASFGTWQGYKAVYLTQGFC